MQINYGISTSYTPTGKPSSSLASTFKTITPNHLSQNDTVHFSSATPTRAERELAALNKRKDKLLEADTVDKSALRKLNREIETAEEKAATSRKVKSTFSTGTSTLAGAGAAVTVGTFLAGEPLSTKTAASAAASFTGATLSGHVGNAAANANDDMRTISKHPKEFKKGFWAGLKDSLG